MLSFITNELVWAIQREREEEIRNIRPHTAGKPDPERTKHDPNGQGPVGVWAAPNLRAGAR